MEVRLRAEGLPYLHHCDLLHLLILIKASFLVLARIFVNHVSLDLSVKSRDLIIISISLSEII